MAQKKTEISIEEWCRNRGAVVETIPNCCTIHRMTCPSGCGSDLCFRVVIATDRTFLNWTCKSTMGKTITDIKELEDACQQKQSSN